MARRRALVVWIDADAKHCGTCVHLEYVCDRYVRCAVFGGNSHPDSDTVPRHPDCLKAETFAGG